MSALDVAPCLTCGHQAHLHRTEGPCCALTVSGPPSTDGHPKGDHYIHAGRTTSACACQTYLGRNGAH